MPLFAIRHTQTTAGQGVCYGQSDVLPNERFQHDIKLIRKQLADYNFDLIYSSPLIRCKLLAENAFPKHSIQYHNDLMELNFGKWEMKSWDVISQTEYGIQWMEQFETLPCPEGESYLELKKRVFNFLESIEKKYQTKNILLVTHAGVIYCLLSILKNLPLKEVFTLYPIQFGQIIEF